MVCNRPNGFELSLDPHRSRQRLIGINQPEKAGVLVTTAVRNARLVLSRKRGLLNMLVAWHKPALDCFEVDCGRTVFIRGGSSFEKRTPN